MLKIKDNVDLKELEKFGFEEIYEGKYVYTRRINGNIAYRVYITKKHHFLQIETFDQLIIASSLQILIYDLIQAGLVEKVEG